MKLDARQDELLKHYLRKVFLYRETYEEVYDHIISALQHQPDAGSFERQVNTIIHDDFGGHNNLVRMEANAKKAIVKDVRRHQLKCFLSFLKFPNLLYVLLFAIAIYRVLAITPLNQFNIRMIFLVLSFVPMFAMPLRYFFTGYVFGDTKRSVKDNTMSDWSMLLFRIFCAGNVIMLLNHQYFFINGFNLFWLTGGVVFYAIYTLSFFKLSKSEFKVSVIK
jgi:hypothetical protein